MSDSNATQRVTATKSHEHRCRSDERWQALPAVIRTTFECTQKTPMHESLRALGVAAEVSQTVQCVYASERGSLVVTVWADRIERESDGSLAYWIDAFDWRPRSQARPAEGGARMATVLGKHLGEEVYVLLLKRGAGGEGVAGAERSAPDIVRWTLESAGQSWFVLRRPMARRVA